jgi:hypothetical protein
MGLVDNDGRRATERECLDGGMGEAGDRCGGTTVTERDRGKEEGKVGGEEREGGGRQGVRPGIFDICILFCDRTNGRN